MEFREQVLDLLAEVAENNIVKENPDELPADFQAIHLEEGVDRAVCDYIAGMTDPFAVSEYTRLFIPMGWGVK